MDTFLGWTLGAGPFIDISQSFYCDLTLSLKDGLLTLVLKASFIVHLRESLLSCDSNLGILAKQSRQFTALSESETSLKAHVLSKTIKSLVGYFTE